MVLEHSPTNGYGENEWHSENLTFLDKQLDSQDTLVHAPTQLTSFGLYRCQRRTRVRCRVLS
jgi:hypothetical protein